MGDFERKKKKKTILSSFPQGQGRLEMATGGATTANLLSLQSQFRERIELLMLNAFYCAGQTHSACWAARQGQKKRVREMD